jgi:hypothetical protein
MGEASPQPSLAPFPTPSSAFAWGQELGEVAGSFPCSQGSQRNKHEVSIVDPNLNWPTALMAQTAFQCSKKSQYHKSMQGNLHGV